MKKIYQIILLSIIFISITDQLSFSQPTILDVNSQTTGNVLDKVTEVVTLSPGFSYTGQGSNSFKAEIVPAGTTAYNFSEPISSTPTINTSNAVGSISGSWSVGSTGAAIYTIPIKVPPGINGVVPNLSICYNSNAGEGTMGLGWGVSGLSGITRVGCDLYHDGLITSVMFSSPPPPQSDYCRFELDGQRLIPVLATNGDIEFRTEVETYSRITAYGGTVYNPQYWVVQTKDGRTLYYGYTTDSRILAQGSSTVVLAWNVNQISDVSGNYITATYYQNNTTGEYYPSTINYTGNSNVEPFNTIQFNYKTRNIPVTNYISGYAVTLNSYLSNITITNGGNQVSEYQFTYNTTTNNSYRLTQITETGDNSNTSISNTLNSTTVTWGTANPSTNVPTGTTFKNGNGISADENIQILGDFNGDGKMDYVIVNNAMTTLTLYTSNGDGTFTNATPNNITLPTGTTYILKGDFDGDGLEDLFVAANTGKTYELYVLRSTGTGFTTIDLNTSDATSSTPTYWIGDYDGDGMNDYIVLYSAGSPTNNCVMHNIKGLTTTPSTPVLAATNLTVSNFVYPSEQGVLYMKGNGKADIMICPNISGSTMLVYEYGNGSINQICSYSSFPCWH